MVMLLAGSAGAGIQTEHAFDSSVDLGRFESLWQFRVRTKPQGGGLFQLRTAPIFEFDLNERVTLIAGCYFTREQSERTWTTTSRPFGGGEVMVSGWGVEIDCGLRGDGGG